MKTWNVYPAGTTTAPVTVQAVTPYEALMQAAGQLCMLPREFVRVEEIACES